MNDNLGQVVLVADINPDRSSNYYFSDGRNSYPENLTEFNDKLYFTANDGETGKELWVSDGTADGTHLLVDIDPSSNNNGQNSNYYYDPYSYLYTSSYDVTGFTEFNDKLYFTANDGKNGHELWVSDGTTDGTHLLLDINPGDNESYYSDYANSSYPANFVEFNDKLYFTANDGENGHELWVSDGTADGTNLLLDIDLGTEDSYYFYSNGSNPDNFVEFNDKLYFTANDGENGDELWVSDGTTEGTHLLLDINPNVSDGYYSYADGSDADNFVEFNDKLYFTADDGENGNELWVSDGTAEGTHLLLDINPGTEDSYYYSYAKSSDADNFIEFNDKLYFTANDGENGNELWVSDGTTEGTHLLLDINPNVSDGYYSYADGSDADNFIEFNDKLYFTANDGENGNELWVSDGTTEGTYLVADINLGNNNYGTAQSSFAANLTVVGDELFFSANNGVSGNELFKLTLDDSTIFINGTNNVDRLVGGTGADRIEGLDGKDSLLGGAGDDSLLGGDGKDTLIGGAGNDTLLGEDGKDSLLGGAGNDVLTGGDGNDVFVIQSDAGTDTITDFDLRSDLLGLSDGLGYGDLTFDGQTISFDGELLATLNGVNTDQLTIDNFEAI